MSDEKVVYVPIVTAVDLDTGEVALIERDQIAKITTEKVAKRETLVFTTVDGKQYRRADTQDEFEEAWYDAGFMRTDITNVVNLSHVKVWDESLGLLHFGHNLSSDVQAHVSMVKKQFVREKMTTYGIITKNELEQRKEAIKQINDGKYTISIPGMA